MSVQASPPETEEAEAAEAAAAAAAAAEAEAAAGAAAEAEAAERQHLEEQIRLTEAALLAQQALEAALLQGSSLQELQRLYAAAEACGGLVDEEVLAEAREELEQMADDLAAEEAQAARPEQNPRPALCGTYS